MVMEFGSKKRPSPLICLVGFVVMAYAVSWSFWLLQVLMRDAFPNDPRLGLLHLLGSLGPAVAGLCMATAAGGRAGLRRLLERVFDWQAGGGPGAVVWHGIAWLGPFVVLFVAQVLAQEAGAAVQPGVLSPSDEFPGLPVWLYWLAVLVFYGFGEEIGWRGFALPLLQSRFHPVVATLLLSLIWAVWHWPLFLFSPGLSVLDPAGMAGWFASLVTGAFLLTFLFNASGGSVLVVAIFHATMDIAFLGPPAVAMRVGALITVAGLVVFALLVKRGRAMAIGDEYVT